MTVSVEKIKQLRDLCGISLGACRKALEETGGDLSAALETLKKTSADIARRKAERATGDGLVLIKTEGDKTAVVVLNCETDFVARNENFIALANALAALAVKDGPEKAKSEAGAAIDETIQKTGENIQLKTIEVITGPVGSYTHNGKIGAVVRLAKAEPQLARDIAMHIAALKPLYKTTSEIPAEKMAEMKSHYETEVANLAKPAEIKTKIIEGKLKEYFRQFTLLEQPFIKDDKMTIADIVKKSGNEISSFGLYTL
jgi:elongation factor Ts